MSHFIFSFMARLTAQRMAANGGIVGTLIPFQRLSQDLQRRKIASDLLEKSLCGHTCRQTLRTIKQSTFTDKSLVFHDPDPYPEKSFRCGIPTPRENLPRCGIQRQGM